MKYKHKCIQCNNYFYTEDIKVIRCRSCVYKNIKGELYG